MLILLVLTMAAAAYATLNQSELASLPEALQQALAWDVHMLANGSVYSDKLYSVRPEQANATPGSLLKLEKRVDPERYTIPIDTAISRFVYQSKKLDNSSVPVSAYILWPYSPRTVDDGFPVVAFAHGTSGITPNSAPSSIKNLYQHYLAPYQLALHGYVVIATDYAGIGVSKDAEGKPIVHEYMGQPAQANDVFYSVQAAQQAFPQLSKKFVVAGHSQGAGVAWQCAQRQAVQPVEGYLGAVALSPITRFLQESEPLRSILTLAALPGAAAYFPGFDLDTVLTPLGKTSLELVERMDATTAPIVQVLSNGTLLKDDFGNNTYLNQLMDIAENGGKQISEPLLVMHGTIDNYLNITLNDEVIKETFVKYPEAPIRYVRITGVTHRGITQCNQHIWMDFIADRFAGRAMTETGQCTLEPALPLTNYLVDQNWYVEKANESYQTP
ncbi:MAG: hypothetical protein MMC23_008785 [Stictis urceolatum]|nr:hypothetical protein [Stictis urceolata]